MSSSEAQHGLDKFSATYNIKMILLVQKPFLTAYNIITFTIHKENPYILS